MITMPGWALAAGTSPDTAGRLKGLGLAESAATPDFGRIVLVFLLLAALAWAAAWLLRRYGGRFRLGSLPGASAIRPVARGSLPGGVSCHLVEAEGQRVLITISRHGVSSLSLGTAPAAAPPTTEPSP